MRYIGAIAGFVKAGRFGEDSYRDYMVGKSETEI